MSTITKKPGRSGVNYKNVDKRTAYQISMAHIDIPIFAGGPTNAQWKARYDVDVKLGEVYSDSSSSYALFVCTVTGANPTWAAIGAAATVTLQAAFANGKVITGANTAANAFCVGDATDYFKFYLNTVANDLIMTSVHSSNITIAPAANLVLAPVSGATTLTGTLDVSSTFTVATNKLSVNATTGDVTIIGRYLTSDTADENAFAVPANGSKFAVNALTGTATTAGFLVSTATSGNALVVNATKFLVAAASGNVTTAGDITVAGNANVTGNVTGTFTGTFSGTWTGSAWNANPTITLTETTGNGLTINGNTVTSGNILYLTADASLVAGNYINCYDSSIGGGTSQFVVADTGVTTIRGPGIGSGALTLTTGDLVLSDGDVDITSATAHGGDIVDITRGNSATGGHAIDILMGTAAVAGNAVNINFGNAASTGHAIALTYSGANTGDALNLNMTNNVAGGALVITGAGTRTDHLIEITDVPNSGASSIYIGATAANNAGHVISISDTGAFSNNLINLAYSGNNATGDAINIAMTAAAVEAQALVVTGKAATTSPLVSLTGSGAAAGDVLYIYNTAGNATARAINILEHGTSTNEIVYILTDTTYAGDALAISLAGAAAGAQAITITDNARGANATSPTMYITAAGGNGGNVLEIASTSTHANGGVIQITESGTVASNLIELAYGGANTGDAVNITMNGANVAAQAIVVSSNVAATSPTVSLTTANGAAVSFYMSNGSVNAAGHGIHVLQHGAGANNAVNVTYDALSTGAALGITMDGAGTAAQAIAIASNVAATTAQLSVAHTGFVGATGVGMVNLTSNANLAHANASMLYIAYSGTGAATGLGTSIRVNDTGATATSYAVYVASATGEALFVDTGKAKFTEAATFKASNRFYIAPNYVTAGGGPNNITATLTDADGSNVTLAAGLELFVNLGATTLQAGANNMNLNAGGNVRIYKGSAALTDLAVVRGNNAILHLVYNGTNWLELSE